jgi:hypothetical protein
MTRLQASACQQSHLRPQQQQVLQELAASLQGPAASLQAWQARPQHRDTKQQ